MAKKTVIEWRKATPEEIQAGSTEMVLVREYEIEVPDESVSSADATVNGLIDQMSAQGKAELAQKLLEILNQ